MKNNTHGWIPSNGEKPDLPDDTLIDVKFTNGDVDIKSRADSWVWSHYDVPYDITHYRIHQPAGQSEPTDEQILAITTAYEQGVGKGYEAMCRGEEIQNPYSSSWGCDKAWQLGYEEGKEKQQPCRQSPPKDPLGGLEYLADGEANFYTLSKPTGNWIARIQFNGELHVQEQERILNAMLNDRNVCYGNGFNDGYWKARGEAPDVSALVKALEIARDTLDNVRGDINPERGYAEELEEDVSVAYSAVLSALEAHHQGEPDNEY